jgi:hypothetical protein
VVGAADVIAGVCEDALDDIGRNEGLVADQGIVDEFGLGVSEPCLWGSSRAVVIF